MTLYIICKNNLINVNKNNIKIQINKCIIALFMQCTQIFNSKSHLVDRLYRRQMETILSPSCIIHSMLTIRY